MNEFPIFLRWHDCGEMDMFSSLEDFNLYVELIDIENNEFEAWDKKGKPISIELTTTLAIKIEHSQKDNSMSLRTSLLDYATKMGVQAPEAENPVVGFEQILRKIRMSEKPNIIERLFGRRK